MARIVIFLGALNNGGAERVAVWLAGCLAARNHSVTLLTLAPAVSDFHTCPEGVRRASLDLVGAHGAFSKIGANLRRVYRLRRFLQVERTEGVIAFMTHESVMAVLASTGLGTRCVISERNAPWKRHPGRIWALARRLTYPFADAAVVQTEAIAAWMRRRVRSRRVHIIPNAVQRNLEGSGRIQSPTDYLPADRKLILAVGSKPNQKGFDLLVSAFAAVASDFPDWDLTLVGVATASAATSPQVSRLLGQISSTTIGPRIHMPGPVGNISDWYERADLFVLPSRFEGFPNALLEAMAYGCACIACDCDTGPRDLITNDKDGILVGVDDVATLTSALYSAMADPQLRMRIADKAKSVACRFDEDVICNLWEDALGISSKNGMTNAGNMGKQA